MPDTITISRTTAQAALAAIRAVAVEARRRANGQCDAWAKASHGARADKAEAAVAEIEAALSARDDNAMCEVIK